MTIRVAFTDFWGGFNPYNNYFTNILDKFAGQEVKVVEPKANGVDILFYSCFGNNHELPWFRDTRRVFFCGENRDPDPEATLNFTFRRTNADKRNYRLPLWILYIDWFDKFTQNPHGIRYSQLFEPRICYQTRFCNFIFNNEAINSPRISYFNELSKYKKIDSYGKLLNNTGQILQGNELIKLSIMRNYKFSICFENSLGEGYVTEKLLHGLFTGVPIYWGDVLASSDFNPLSYIGGDFNTIKKDLIQYIDSQEFMYHKYLSEPIFLNNKLPANFEPEVVCQQILQLM